MYIITNPNILGSPASKRFHAWCSFDRFVMGLTCSACMHVNVLDQCCGCHRAHEVDHSGGMGACTHGSPLPTFCQRLKRHQYKGCYSTPLVISPFCASLIQEPLITSSLTFVWPTGSLMHASSRQMPCTRHELCKCSRQVPGV